MIGLRSILVPLNAEPLGAVFSSVPLVVFGIVFGPSMDYQAFLMTRVMEALGTTGPVITNAAGSCWWYSPPSPPAIS